MRVTGLSVYPIKSCRGTDLDAVAVEPWGLSGDRRWMLVDADGDVVTAREAPRLLLAVPRQRGDGGLTVSGPSGVDLEVAVPEDDGVPVRLWKSELNGVPAGASAHAWFSELAGQPVRLVYLADPTQRPVSPVFAEPNDRVSFADGYPLLVANAASLDALNDAVLSGPRADEGPLPITRFRPNVVVSGGEPWAEDAWRRIRIGAATFRSPKGCARCVMTTVDPWDASKGREPIATLARVRRFDGATWFGMNLVPDNPGATIRIGDEVEVLAAVSDPDGPPR